MGVQMIIDSKQEIATEAYQAAYQKLSGFR